MWMKAHEQWMYCLTEFQWPLLLLLLFEQLSDVPVFSHLTDGSVGQVDFSPSKGIPILETSVRFQSWYQSSAVSPQVTEAINPAKGCDYFPPGTLLPPQPQDITAHWLVPNYTAWWLRHVCKQLVQGCTRQRGGQDSNPQPVDWKSGFLSTQPQKYSKTHLIRVNTC